MNSNRNITEMLVKMLEGDKITMEEAKSAYNLSEKSIQRYLADIRDVLNEHNIDAHFVHDFKNHNYYITKDTDIPFNEIIAISKILIGTRAFGKHELNQLTNHLYGHLSIDEKSIATKMNISTISKYIPIKSKYDLLPRISQLSNYIDSRTTVSFEYTNSSQKIVRGVALPISMYFDTFYFYVLMYDETLHNTHPYRIDRFTKIKKNTATKIKIPRELKKDEGSELNNTYLLNDGKHINFELYYSGNAQNILDQFPQSKVKKTLDNGSLIEGNAYAQGLLLWIMGQGSRVRVKSPASLVKDVKDELQKTLKYYE